KDQPADNTQQSSPQSAPVVGDFAAALQPQGRGVSNTRESGKPTGDAQPGDRPSGSQTGKDGQPNTDLYGATNGIVGGGISGKPNNQSGGYLGKIEKNRQQPAPSDYWYLRNDKGDKSG